MPWHIDGDHPDCGGWAVVKDSDGTVEGCHDSLQEAHAQMAALYASEEDSRMTTTADLRRMEATLRDGARAAAAGRPDGVHERVHTIEARQDGHHGDGLSLTGYITVFNQVERIRDWLGEYDEQIAPEAFDRTLEQRGPERVRMQFDHGFDFLFGELPIGTWHEMTPDETGLYGTGRLLDTWHTVPIRAAIESGAVSGMSFRFQVKREEWDTNGDVDLRTITELSLLEAGPVVWPAYEATTVDLRSTVRSDALSLWRGILAGDTPHVTAASPGAGTRTQTATTGSEAGGPGVVTLAEMRKRALELRGVTAHASTRGGSPAAV